VSVPPGGAGVLNMEPGAWAFAGVAESLARALHVPVVDRPAHWNYCFYRPADVDAYSFIPAEAVRVASDKRLQADLFAGAGVPTPDTSLVADLAEARRYAQRPGRWVLKYPVACGAAGHRLLTEDTRLPRDWPKPLLIQAFVEMDRPEVYRLYGAAGRPFGWNVRRYRDDVPDPSPWVAHATGAAYKLLGVPPAGAVEAAAAALNVTGLNDSFGCVDLLPSPGGWLVLEVGTDGPDAHVDRAVPQPLAGEINEQIHDAFWNWVSRS